MAAFAAPAELWSAWQDTEPDSQPAGRTAAEQAPAGGLRRGRHADQESQALAGAESQADGTETGGEAGAGTASAAETEAGTARGAETPARPGTASTAEQFARFEVVSETARQRAATRQTKITSYLGK